MISIPVEDCMIKEILFVVNKIKNNEKINKYFLKIKRKLFKKGKNNKRN